MIRSWDIWPLFPQNSSSTSSIATSLRSRRNGAFLLYLGFLSWDRANRTQRQTRNMTLLRDDVAALLMDHSTMVAALEERGVVIMEKSECLQDQSRVRERFPPAVPRLGLLLFDQRQGPVNVGLVTRVTPLPAHRSRRAPLTHRAPPPRPNIGR